MWQFGRAVEGITAACKALGIPITGGNVSLYNETDGNAIYPTPVLGVVGLIEDAAKILGRSFKASGDAIVLLGTTRQELGGSEYLKVTQRLVAGVPPDVDLRAETALQHFLVAVAREAIGAICARLRRRRVGGDLSGVRVQHRGRWTERESSGSRRARHLGVHIHVVLRIGLACRRLCGAGTARCPSGARKGTWRARSWKLVRPEPLGSASQSMGEVPLISRSATPRAFGTAHWKSISSSELHSVCNEDRMPTRQIECCDECRAAGRQRGTGRGGGAPRQIKKSPRPTSLGKSAACSVFSGIPRPPT